VNPEIAEMAAGLTTADIATLKALSNTEPQGIISASFNFEESRAEGTKLDHMIGVATTQPAPEPFQMLQVPAGTWAVFTARGTFPDALQSLWSRIYSEWFPGSGYEVRLGPEILWNESHDTSQPDYHSEIWIPVVKR
jgi:AraC family transcriptional regulator